MGLAALDATLHLSFGAECQPTQLNRLIDPALRGLCIAADVPPGDNPSVLPVDARPSGFGSVFMPVPYRAQQSPIDFADAREKDLLKECDFPAGYGQNNWPATLPATPDLKEGGTNYVFAGVSPAIGLTIDGEFYHLAQFHFHADPEHLLGDEVFAAELHIVHQTPYPPSKITPQPGQPLPPRFEPEDIRYAVLGIWLVVGDGSKGLNDFLIGLSGKAGGRRRAAEDADGPILVPMEALLPTNPEQFFRYEGSLTTKRDDDNVESVKWLVYRNPLVVSRAVLRAVKRVAYPAKSKQYVNRRFVLTSLPVSGPSGP